jgi:hypothetical protein
MPSHGARAEAAVVAFREEWRCRASTAAQNNFVFTGASSVHSAYHVHTIAP